MSILINRSNLQSALVQLVKIIDKRPASPILSCVLVAPDKNGVVLKTSNLKEEITIALEAEVQDIPQFVVPAELFFQSIKEIEGEEIEININILPGEEAIENWSNQKAICQLCHDYGIIDVNCFVYEESTKEFPNLIDKSQVEFAGSINCGTFLSSLQTVAIASSRDETKGILNGVCLKSLDNGLSFQATNGHFCAIYNLEEELELSGELIIVNSSLEAIYKILLANKESDCYIGNLDNIFYLQVENTFAVFNTLLGAWPKCEKLFPDTSVHTISFDPAILLKTLSRCSLLEVTGSEFVTLEFYENTLVAHLQTEWGKVEENLIVVNASLKDAIYLQLKYLQTILKAYQSINVKMKVSTPQQPIVFTSTEKDFSIVIAPIQPRE